MSSDEFTPDGLRTGGFVGFVPIANVRQRLSLVPSGPGVYAIVREHVGPAAFLETSTGGWFKGKNPSVPMDKLSGKWIDAAYVLYIGKAGAGSTGTRGLRTRISEYLQFGSGQPVGHWGGRYLWHLADTPTLQIAWKLASDPSQEEADLLDRFANQYGVLPYANLRRGTSRKRQ